MILEALSEHKNVREAARAMAGNYRNWPCFVWFGERDVPNSRDVMLGYLVNFEASLRQLTNMEHVKARLARWWGGLEGACTADDFSSSFCGPERVRGLAVRVYDDKGRITRAFRELYAVALEHKRSKDGVVDQETFERVREREMLAYVRGRLKYECADRGETFHDADVEDVVRELISKGVDFDNDEVDVEIHLSMGWAAPETRLV